MESLLKWDSIVISGSSFRLEFRPLRLTGRIAFQPEGLASSLRPRFALSQAALIWSLGITDSGFGSLLVMLSLKAFVFASLSQETGSMTRNRCYLMESAFPSPPNQLMQPTAGRSDA
jgi:hypothetical protein